jgi:hypothetical protein
VLLQAGENFRKRSLRSQLAPPTYHPTIDRIDVIILGDISVNTAAKETTKHARGGRYGHASHGRLLCPVRLFAWKREEMRPVLCGSSIPSSIGVRKTAHARKGAVLETSVRLVLRGERVRVGEGRRARRLFGQGAILVARASDADFVCLCSAEF